MQFILSRGSGISKLPDKDKMQPIPRRALQYSGAAGRVDCKVQCPYSIPAEGG
jgi:hypothetical protein